MRVERNVSQDLAEVIGLAIERIPVPVLELLEPVRFVCTDPIFIGLHDYETVPDGRSYRDTAHFCHPGHLRGHDRPPTVVLPGRASIRTVIHELGHAVDLETQATAAGLRPEPVTHYACRNPQEAFAEAFTAWLHPESTPWAPEYFDDRTLEYFEQLAGGVRQ